MIFLHAISQDRCITRDLRNLKNYVSTALLNPNAYLSNVPPSKMLVQVLPYRHCRTEIWPGFLLDLITVEEILCQHALCAELMILVAHDPHILLLACRVGLPAIKNGHPRLARLMGFVGEVNNVEVCEFQLAPVVTT
jgi:hypothetical protein